MITLQNVWNRLVMEIKASIAAVEVLRGSANKVF